jgi:hypothetical protein
MSPTGASARRSSARWRTPRRGEVGLILQAARSGTWSAAAWLLERRWPERWGRRRAETPAPTAGTALTGDDELDERALDAEFERLLAEMSALDQHSNDPGGNDGG